MESYKVLATVALLVACVYAAQANEQQQQQQPLPLGPNANVPFPGPSSVSPLGVDEKSPLREKKQALYPYAYAAYPYAAYPYAAYPYSYSYQYQDDGKYYPGKYEKPYYRAAYPYYYPSYYYY